MDGTDPTLYKVSHDIVLEHVYPKWKSDGVQKDLEQGKDVSTFFRDVEIVLNLIENNPFPITTKR